jgi:hydrogenase maturation protein HypF
LKPSIHFESSTEGGNKPSVGSAVRTDSPAMGEMDRSADATRPAPQDGDAPQFEHHTPSPGTPGEGGGEGAFFATVTQDPHPNPLPEYRARGPKNDPRESWVTGNTSSPMFQSGVRLVAVQHHHAHMASCMAEHGLSGPLIGVTFDGSGFGTDGAIWGGEFLTGGYDRFERAAHLRYVAMPGGEQAVREPWRMAFSHLLDAASTCAPFERRIPGAMLATARRMIERRLNSPMTSSAGRLFDAVASLAGVRDCVTYEGQAAIELEWLAASVPAGTSYPFAFDTSPTPGLSPPIIIDTRPIIYAVVADVASGVSKQLIARRFHSTLVEIVAEACRRIRTATRLETVVLSGGVFMNALLTLELEQRLQTERFQVYRHEVVPPNDGGLCLGQVAVAASLVR